MKNFVSGIPLSKEDHHVLVGFEVFPTLDGGLLQLALFCVQNVSPALSQLRHFCCCPPLISSSVWLLLSVMKKDFTDKVRLALGISCLVGRYVPRDHA